MSRRRMPFAGALMSSWARQVGVGVGVGVVKGRWVWLSHNCNSVLTLILPTFCFNSAKYIIFHLLALNSGAKNLLTWLLDRGISRFLGLYPRLKPSLSSWAAS